MTADCLDFDPFEIFPHDAWVRMENQQLEEYAKFFTPCLSSRIEIV